MTDNEIVKAVEHCHRLVCGCVGCPFDGETDCLCKSGEAILDLINRQKAEIDSLNEQERILIYQLAFEREKAIKEFAERLKESKIEVDVSYGFGREHYTEAVAVAEIDNIVKEMTEERNGRIQ